MGAPRDLHDEGVSSRRQWHGGGRLEGGTLGRLPRLDPHLQLATLLTMPLCQTLVHNAGVRLRVLVSDGTLAAELENIKMGMAKHDANEEGFRAARGHHLPWSGDLEACVRP